VFYVSDGDHGLALPQGAVVVFVQCMDLKFCVEALEEALARHGWPRSSDKNHGNAGIRISMNGRGRWMDNVFIVLLWRSLKYACVHLLTFGFVRAPLSTSCGGLATYIRGGHTPRWPGTRWMKHRIEQILPFFQGRLRQRR
jgi:hypothetical protein